MAETLTLVPPAYRWVPPHVATFGDEVADLADSCGMSLDPEQRDVLRDWFVVNDVGQLVATQATTVAPRQNVKTHAGVAAAIGDLVLFEEPQSTWSSHLLSTTKKTFEYVQSRFENYDHLRRLVYDVIDRDNERAIILLSKAGQPKPRLDFMARGQGAGRGQSGNRNTYDEALYLTYEMLGDTLPTLSAKSMGGMSVQLRYLSSAAKRSSEVLLQLVRQGRKGGLAAATYSEWCAPYRECERGDDCDHGLETPGCCYSDFDLLQAANLALERRISYSFVVNTERPGFEGGPEEYARERFGWHQGLEETKSGVNLRRWAACKDEASQPKERPRVALAVDCQPLGRRSSIGLATFRADGRQHLEVIENRPGTAWVPERLNELVDRYDPCCTSLDPEAHAGTLVPALEQLGITLTLVTAREMSHACTSFVEDANAKAQPLVHIGQEQLDAAIKGAREADRGDGLKKFVRKSSAVDISPLICVVLAKRGRDLHADDDYDVADSLY